MIIPFPQKSEDDAAKAWETYVRLAVRAQETLKLEDGLAAGKAYGQFVKLFTNLSEAPR